MFLSLFIICCMNYLPHILEDGGIAVSSLSVPGFMERMSQPGCAFSNTCETSYQLRWNESMIRLSDSQSGQVLYVPVCVLNIGV